MNVIDAPARRALGRLLLIVCALGLALAPAVVEGQTVRIRDLTVSANDIPVRLMGYGLVVGLDGTGDRVVGGYSSGQTVRSVANLLRRFNVEVPEQLLRTRNVAAVLVTAETSPYLRPGGRFEVQVASLGDAASLRGGVLWMTPLVSEVGQVPVATAQGTLMMSEGTAVPGSAAYAVETSGRIPDGGLLEQAMPRPDFAGSSSLLLREPDLALASRIAQAINDAVGAGSAAVEDPGAVALTLQDGDPSARAQVLAQIGDITVTRDRVARVIIDGRDGTVVAGGGLTIGEAMVSHGGMTLSIGGAALAGDGGVLGDVRVPEDSTVQDVASALHAVAAPPASIATVFESLRAVGALSAEVLIR